MRPSHRCAGLAGALLLLAVVACDEDRCPGGSRPAVGTVPRIESKRTPIGAQRDQIESDRDCVGVERTQVGTEHAPVGVKRGELERSTQKTPVSDPPDTGTPTAEAPPEG